MSDTSSRFTLELPSDTEIRMERSFKAPRERVFKAVTDPELIAKWWGLRSTTTIVDTFDPRVGGKWRFIQRGENGEEYAFRGEFLEIEPPSKVVQTFEFEGMPGHVVTDSMTLSEDGDGTRIRIDSKFASKEDRDGMIQSGMEVGANESYDQLDELLATLTSK